MHYTSLKLNPNLSKILTLQPICHYVTQILLATYLPKEIKIEKNE